MKTYSTIEIEFKNNAATIWLNRPAIHNAFNEIMIREILDALNWLEDAPQIGVVIFRGRGPSFCAGADLNWMRDVKNYTYRQNFEESHQLARCFHTIYTFPKPTIAAIHGASIGGANGIVAACDITWATQSASFSLSEVKIGIVPACIAPYVIKRTGEFNARELMLTGRRFGGEEANIKQLITGVVSDNKLDEKIAETVSLLNTSGPEAMKHCKRLIFELSNKLNLDQAIGFSARMIADIRKSDEGQEGMAAFLEKREPQWITKRHEHI